MKGIFRDRSFQCFDMLMFVASAVMAENAAMGVGGCLAGICCALLAEQKHIPHSILCTADQICEKKQEQTH